MYIIYELIISRIGKHFKVLFFLLSVFLVVLGVYYGAEMLGESDSRYALGADMSTRTDIYQKSWNYILENPFGGIYELSNNGIMPHNLFLNAMVYGGYLGGLAIIFLIFIQLKICVITLFRLSIKKHLALLMFILAWLSFFICSLAHNLSIVTGDVHVWIFWAAIICLIERYNIKTKVL